MVTTSVSSFSRPWGLGPLTPLLSEHRCVQPREGPETTQRLRLVVSQVDTTSCSCSSWSGEAYQRVVGPAPSTRIPILTVLPTVQA